MSDRDALSVIVSNLLGASKPASTRAFGPNTPEYKNVAAHIEWFMQLPDGAMHYVWNIEASHEHASLDSTVELLLESFKDMKLTYHSEFTDQRDPDADTIHKMLNLSLDAQA